MLLFMIPHFQQYFQSKNPITSNAEHITPAHAQRGTIIIISISAASMSSIPHALLRHQFLFLPNISAHSPALSYAQLRDIVPDAASASCIENSRMV